jgi:hypothetical protein
MPPWRTPQRKIWAYSYNSDEYFWRRSALRLYGRSVRDRGKTGIQIQHLSESQGDQESQWNDAAP